MEKYQELEAKFSEWNELDPEGMVACSSGTAALHLAFEAMELPLGSQVIVPDLTMIACPRAVTLAGLSPKFVDCLDDLTVGPDALRNAFIKHTTKALLTVHTYGRLSSYSGILPVSVRWIEDLAEAHGLRPATHTDAACWSFYKNKIVAGEEGGAVWFRDPEHAKLARQLRSLGFTDDHDFVHVPRGHNYRMSNAHAKLILPSLAEADENIKKRRQTEAWYDELIPNEWKMPRRDVVWVYDLRIPGMTGEVQNRLVKGLNEKGIGARHCFKITSSQEEYRELQPVSPNALRLSQEIIYLPVLPMMTEQDVTQIVNELIQITNQSLDKVDS